MPDNEKKSQGIAVLVDTVYNMINGPITWFRESVIEPNRPKYNYYHRKYNRVPTIDQCDTDDVCCIFEANIQYKRDNKVDSEILCILRRRMEDCNLYEFPNHVERCAPIMEQYKEAELNWFIKYGDLGAFQKVTDAYMKQKHRLVWERRQQEKGEQLQLS